jgi:hypothetical protein
MSRNEVVVEIIEECFVVQWSEVEWGKGGKLLWGNERYVDAVKRNERQVTVKCVCATFHDPTYYITVTF